MVEITTVVDTYILLYDVNDHRQRSIRWHCARVYYIIMLCEQVFHSYRRHCRRRTNYARALARTVGNGKRGRQIPERTGKKTRNYVAQNKTSARASNFCFRIEGIGRPKYALQSRTHVWEKCTLPPLPLYAFLEDALGQPMNQRRQELRSRINYRSIYKFRHPAHKTFYLRNRFIYLLKVFRRNQLN